MNRPSRVPSPSQSVAYAEPHDDASFQEIEQPNNLPARASQGQIHAIPDRAEPEQPDLPVTAFDKLAGAIADVMAEIKPVEKEGWNDFQKYRYARMQDLSRELTPLMGKHGIVIFQTEEGREMFDDGKAVAVRYRFTITHKSGQIWPERMVQTGLSSCRNSKGGFDDKTLNKCHTSARKYFLLSLFQIPTADEDDADSAGETETAHPRPQGRRPVPSPDGKLKPHLIPINDGEQPQSWAMRYGAFVEKAPTSDEIDQWYQANAAIFEKLKAASTQVYNDSIDFMDACTAKLAAPKKADPISSGSFPGDKPLPAKDDGLDIPANLRRAQPTVTDDEREWLESLDNAFTGCEGPNDLLDAQQQYMTPRKDQVSAEAWKRATKIIAAHTDRIAKNG